MASKNLKIYTEQKTPEIESLWERIEKVKANQFIMTSDDARIRQWEDSLHIRPDYEKQNLDVRRKAIVMKTSTRLPLTYRWLEEKLNSIDSSIDGGGSDKEYHLEYDNYYLEVQLPEYALPTLNTIHSYVREQVPANLVLGFKCVYEFENIVMVGQLNIVYSQLKIQ